MQSCKKKENEQTTNVSCSSATKTVDSTGNVLDVKPEPQQQTIDQVAEQNNLDSVSLNNSIVYVNHFFKDNEDNKEELCVVKDQQDPSFLGSCSTLNQGENLPLLPSHTTAYNDSLSINHTNSQISNADSGWISFCRICHGGESVGDLLSPCKCRGSIAKTHLHCLERWLKESANSHCELCRHHFEIIRKPKYGIVASVFMFLMHPGDDLKELLLDLLAFVVYTPATIASTYMLMLICETAAKTTAYQTRNSSIHVMTMAAVCGMAAVDFTYSSWLAANVQKHTMAWRSWYRSHCDIKLVLPEKNELPCITPVEHPSDLTLLENEVD